MLYCDNPELADNSSTNILIVEDSKLINNVIHKTLQSLGHKCEQAFDFEETTLKLEESKFDYIILDLNLPDAYGEELVSAIIRLSKAKIIVLTSEKDIQMRETLFNYGILDYVVKDKHLGNSIDLVHRTIHQINKNRVTNILAIDDSQFMCKQITKVLNTRNYNVLTALNAEDGVKTLNENLVNMIVLDMELPDKHGLDFLRELKAIPEFCKTPIIVISGTNDPETVRSCLKLGAFDYIKKPFNIEEFVLKVDHAVEINRKDREILCSQQLLTEYKNAIDENIIVSKTDIKGNITFVNNMFCEISGYTLEELVGKPHNVVRHPDMPASAFKDMWETIQNKKVWHGKVKNKKKNGDAYYVDTSVNPIVDYDGNIVEYIGIRTDITELELMKNKLESDLDISNENFEEADKLAQDYQTAIDHSNILSRADINGKITYVNQEFCDISGYTTEELIGESHSIIKHPSNSKKTYKELWDTVTSGKTWKGQLKNLSKDGRTYYVESTIVPIKNKHGVISEYLAIRHDVTQIVEMHKELEDTQKEVIHKMGEVGETRSKETGYHVKRVAEYSKLLALLAGLGKNNADMLYAASPMHDIGKVGIPDNILLKPGKFEAEEWEIMKKHSEMGYNILKKSTRPILRAASIVAYRHHEKWDGSGYPNGIAGEKIHIFGRITAIADVFDALGSERVYKKAWELERILGLLEDERGKHFDPNLIDLFLNNLDKFLKIRDKYKDM